MVGTLSELVLISVLAVLRSFTSLRIPEVSALPTAVSNLVTFPYIVGTLSALTLISVSAALRSATSLRIPEDSASPTYVTN